MAKNIGVTRLMCYANSDLVSQQVSDIYNANKHMTTYKAIMDELSGEYTGIGVTIKSNVIVAVTENSPAKSAGLLKDDVIMSINGTDVSNMNSSKISELIKKSDSNTVELVINRNNQTLELSIDKATLSTLPVSYEIIKNTNIGYISIDTFSANLTTHVANALTELEGKGITSLIIDLRDNAGGYLAQAEDVASLFLKKGTVIYSLQTSTNTYTYKDTH